MAYRNRYFGGGEVLTLPSTHVMHWAADDILEPTPAAQAARRRYRRRKANTVGQRYTLAEIIMRDGSMCHLCRTPVDLALSGRDRMGPTADHLIPVALGGGDEAHNIALAHRRCNIKRGVRPLAVTDADHHTG